VTQALRRLVRIGALSPARAWDALENLRSLRLARFPHHDCLRRIWELRDNLTAYDAIYVALAESLRATLVTCDQRLAAAPGIRTQVEVVR
jgi:predicted nucleic acid-binding protein